MHKITIALFSLLSASALDAQNLSWVQHPGRGAVIPTPRYDYGIAYDSKRDNILMFGGQPPNRPNAYFNGLFQNEGGVGWVRLDQSSSNSRPLARSEFGFVYDQARDKFVLFGGGSPQGFQRDTWTFDPQTGLWTLERPSVIPAGIRGDFAMGYDAARQETVLFGGGGFNSFFGDTWIWNGTNWRNANPTNAPLARCCGNMAFDSLRNRLILFGGFEPGAGRFDDTWAWDGTNWTQIQTQNAPSPRDEHGLAYDAARDRVVLYGGVGVGNTNLVDTWEFDGQDWIQIQTPTNAGNVQAGGLVYHAGRSRVFRLGGDFTATQVAFYGPLVPASVTNSGTGCGGARGVPTITTRSTPFLDNQSFILSLNGAPSTTGILGLAARTTPTRVLGCSVDILPDVPLPVQISPIGLAGQRLAIPNAPSLIGGRIHAQLFLLDPTGPQGLTASQLMTLVIGD